MSIREGLARNRDFYARTLARREGVQHPVRHRLPEWSEDAQPERFAGFSAQTVAPIADLPPQSGTVRQESGVAAPPPDTAQPEELAGQIFRALEQEGRFRSQDLWGEEA